MSSNDFISLLCPTCGAPLRVSTSHTTFNCDHCGVPHILRASVNGFIAEPIMRRIDDVQNDIGKLRNAVRIPELRREVQEAGEAAEQLRCEYENGVISHRELKRHRSSQIKSIVFGICFLVIAGVIGFSAKVLLMGFGLFGFMVYSNNHHVNMVTGILAFIPGIIGMGKILAGFGGIIRYNRKLYDSQIQLNAIDQQRQEWREYLNAKKEELWHCEAKS